MAPNSDESKKNNQTTAQGATTATRTDARAATTATHKAGATTAPTKKGVANATAPTKAGATTASTKAGAAAIAAQPAASPLKKTGSASSTAPTKAGTATAAPKSGGAVTSAQPGPTPSNKIGSATASAPTKTGGVTTPSIKNATTNSINKTDDETDWAAIRKQEAHKRPNVKSVQVAGDIAMLDLFIKNQDESKATIHRACPTNNASQEVRKNDRTVPISK
ncbi:hypothetical protein F5883DRAFT_587830 [Diaporthe sp. PMI_573]|jgi:hypothetical protein|nr:hypothetical protein F5883DRAFT_587830 [Diaporthaceae sp. PMI_573]